jgi:hypothetical protein
LMYLAKSTSELSTADGATARTGVVPRRVEGALPLLRNATAAGLEVAVTACIVACVL